jgi:prepilin-type processing-associated H-X9-DG protein
MVARLRTVLFFEEIGMHRNWVGTRRAGITLVDVIVVIVIVALFLGLFIPSVLGARESARRQQCKNNLKQLGLALHNYHDACNTFPPGYVLGENSPYLGWGWGVLITPYIDASPYYNQVSPLFGSGLQHEYANKVLNPQVSGFMCPSASASSLVSHVSVVTTNVDEWRVTPGTADAADLFARTTYFGVAGYLQKDAGGIARDTSGTPPASEPFINAGSLGCIGKSFSHEHMYCDQENFKGIFGQNSRIRLKDITDGTSEVIIVGERYIPLNTSVNSVGHGTWVGVPDCTTAAGLGMTLGDTGIRLNAGARKRAETTGFGSHHSGGAHFLLADGSVRFLANEMNIQSYRMVSVIDDNPPRDEF